MGYVVCPHSYITLNAPLPLHEILKKTKKNIQSKKQNNKRKEKEL